MNHDASITVILAIAAALWPIIFGAALWQLSRVFVSKENFDVYKTTAENDRHEMKAQIAGIGEDIKLLLQRTAQMNHEKERRERER